MSPSVGVLGGAFNPPHLGHLLLAQEAVAALGLDELILVPTGTAPHKRIEPEPGAAVRLEMTAAAVAARPGFGSDAVDDVLGRLGAADGAAQIEMPPVGISSTLVRERVAAGRPIRWMVPDAVARLIAERGLYGAAA